MAGKHAKRAPRRGENLMDLGVPNPQIFPSKEQLAQMLLRMTRNEALRFLANRGTLFLHAEKELGIEMIWDLLFNTPTRRRVQASKPELRIPNDINVVVDDIYGAIGDTAVLAPVDTPTHQIAIGDDIDVTHRFTPIS